MNGKILKMNNENEKKWFIYVGDHHEGPFNANEVHEKKNAGLITVENYVWCEGMPDWVALQDAKELMQELATKNNSEPEKNVTPIVKKEPSEPKKPSKKSAWAGLVVGTVVGFFFFSILTLSALSHFGSEGVHARIRPILSKITNRVPALSPLFKLVPSLPDLTPEEMNELERASSGVASAGAKLGIGLSQNDSNRPSFYLGTNLPDRTKFEIYLIGNPETLLNRLQFSSQMPVITNQGFGRSEVFLAEGGQLIPKGEYQVYVVESPDQDESVKSELALLQNVRPQTKLPPQVPESSHFVFTKTYFLGGPRDEAYLTRLKAFQEKIKQNAERETVELKQYTDTLNAQFTALTTDFAQIYQTKKPTPAMTKTWKKDAATWQQINQQLEQTIQTWSAQTLQNEFFYGKVYELVKSAYDSIKTLFTLENGFIDQPSDPNTFGIQHGKAVSEASSALELLKLKVDFILKAPKSASGLPTKEGL